MNESYYASLKNRLFKVLVWYEEYPEQFSSYLSNLKKEIRGNTDYPVMQRVYYLLNYLSLYDEGHDDVKKTVMDCIGIIDGVLMKMRGHQNGNF